GSITSQACPARPLVIRNGGIGALNQDPTTSEKSIFGTDDVPTTKGTLVASIGKLMPPAWGKRDEAKFVSRTTGTTRSRACAWPAGASSTIVAGTRSPLTMTLRLIETEFGPLAAQKSLNVVPVGGTRLQPRLHSCWNVQVPKPVPCAGEQRYRIPSWPLIGAMPPHINPSHWKRAPAWEPLEKSAGRGCAVTLIVALRVVPLAAALIVTVKPIPLYARYPALVPTVNVPVD